MSVSDIFSDIDDCEQGGRLKMLKESSVG